MRWRYRAYRNTRKCTSTTTSEMLNWPITLISPTHSVTNATISTVQVSTTMLGCTSAQWSRDLNWRNCRGQFNWSIHWQYGQSNGSSMAMAFTCQGLRLKVMSQ